MAKLKVVQDDGTTIYLARAIIDNTENPYIAKVWGTHDPTQAMEFPSIVEALEYWKTVSTIEPVRPDGKPNRPLSAYTVEVER